ncbi:hypothetical protein [uncultured Ferrimonas sp.]|uniref:hypothetical protein n=1 Tax=uncultured Ferrimonas sp. TaxID=432640 RepID=UPI0026186B93|nr:hypothetical protein [uncultured Ferrimonas sp.]
MDKIAQAAPPNMNSPATLPAPLSVQLPIRRYQLTLQHQLLSALGTVSQFVLQALATDGTTLHHIKTITALTDSHLEPILTRLESLGWFDLDRQCLTEMGLEMAQAAALNGQSQPLYLDAIDSMGALFCCMDAQQLQQPTPDTAVVVPEFERDWNVQKVQQTRRLTRKLSDDDGTKFVDFIGQLWPQQQAIIDSQRHAWQFQLSVDGDQINPLYREVTLPQGTPLETEHWYGYTVQLPLIRCRIEYQVPPLLAAQLPPQPPFTQDFCLVSATPLSNVTESVSRKQDLHWPTAQLHALADWQPQPPATSPLLSQHVSLTQACRAVILGRNTLLQALLAQAEPIAPSSPEPQS